jgi:hypothetical protein
MTSLVLLRESLIISNTLFQNLILGMTKEIAVQTFAKWTPDPSKPKKESHVERYASKQDSLSMSVHSPLPFPTVFPTSAESLPPPTSTLAILMT